MNTISCLSQKGGVGKSTLARLIAVAYAKAGYRVKIADFNVKQKTCVNWVSVRQRIGHLPEVSAEPFSSVQVALRQAPIYDIMIFDTRPDSDTESLAVAKASELCLLPTGVTIDDLEPTFALARELTLKGVEAQRLRFVITNPPDSPKTIEEARSLIAGRGYKVIATTIPFRVSYQQALDQGLALNEVAIGVFRHRLQPLNDRADTQATEIYEALESLKEKAA